MLPELDALTRGLEAGAEDGFERSLRTLDAVAAKAPEQERLALAALLSGTGTEAARAALDRLRVAARDAEAVIALIEAAGTPYTADWSDADVRRFMAGLAPELLDDLLVLRQACVA